MQVLTGALAKSQIRRLLDEDEPRWNTTDEDARMNL